MKKYLESLSTKKKYAAAFAFGALMVLCMAPAGAFPLLLVCVSGFIFLSRAAETKRQAFLTGWAFGAGYFIFGLYWISDALFVDIGRFWPVLPLSLIVGPAILGLYYGFIPLLARRYAGNGAAYALAFVAAWSGVEWLRGHLFTGFPWNLPGYAWQHVLPVMQVSAFAGIYGLTLLTLAWAAIPALAGNRKLAAAVGASFIVIATLGIARLSAHPAQSSGQTVRIVQAAIPETMKWDRGEALRNLDRHIALSAGTPAAYIVWPETALGMMTPATARRIAAGLPRGSLLVAGMVREEDKGFYNSVGVLDHSGRVTGVYDKHHLVPFGEYMPFRGILNMTPVAAAIAGMGDFSRGPGPRTLGAQAPFSPLICYEVIFPFEVVDDSGRKPEWLVNVTNDAWYGRTAGPYQHFEISRMRAVEEGLPLARAANTGISGMIDPLGRVMARKGLDEAGAIDVALPKPLDGTVYGAYGDSLFFLMMAGLLGFSEYLRRKK